MASLVDLFISDLRQLNLSTSVLSLTADLNEIHHRVTSPLKGRSSNFDSLAWLLALTCEGLSDASVLEECYLRLLSIFAKALNIFVLKASASISFVSFSPSMSATISLSIIVILSSFYSRLLFNCVNLADTASGSSSSRAARNLSSSPTIFLAEPPWPSLTLILCVSSAIV